MATVLVVGSGGREHALSWKIAQSPHVARVLVLPGNGCTASPNTSGSGKISNLAEDVKNHSAVIASCVQHTVELVVVGPEDPLAEGLADSLVQAGLKCFGPSKAAAEIEASKAFSKDFMARHMIPTAEFKNFTDYDAAIAYIDQVKHNVVIKASGLAAGKGVLLPANKEEARQAVKEVMVDKAFGAAGNEVVIEEFMEGPEASIFAFSDGTHFVCMPAAQDHKRIGNCDTGLNTGGMGAYCPAPVVTPELAKQIETTIVKPAVQGLKAEGKPFVGCLFTGVMLTAKGPMTLEYNCRFGDPETEVVLPLLDDENGNDLYEILLACASGTLDKMDVRWKSEHAATIVMASEGYPEKYPKGLIISGIEKANTHEGTRVFAAGVGGGQGAPLVTSGGRVLTVTGQGKSLIKAVQRAYTGVHEISFQGAQYRHDIAYRALPPARKLRLGVLGSTRGTDMQAIIDAINGGRLTCATIEVVVSNVKSAGILDKAKTHGLNHNFVSGKGKTREEFDALVTAKLEEHKVDLVLLIGFMRIVSKEFCTRWSQRAMNVHPSLLPLHAGGMDCNVHEEVLAAKESETGCTIHWVTTEVDCGGIVLQKRCGVEPNDSVDTLKAKVQTLEGVAFLEVIRMFATGQIGPTDSATVKSPAKKAEAGSPAKKAKHS